MSAKYFCDRCERELSARDHKRLRAVDDVFQVEVMTSVRGTWNGGNICHACVRQIVAKGKYVECD